MSSRRNTKESLRNMSIGLRRRTSGKQKTATNSFAIYSDDIVKQFKAKLLSSLSSIQQLCKMSVSKPTPKQVRTYQPTYQLKPRKHFSTEVIQKILKRIVDSELEEIEYSEKSIPDVCSSLAENIRTAVKEENYDRYRILVLVSIGQRRQQSVHMFHSFLWDHERDGFASYNYENCHLYSNVVVYGVYLD